MRLEAILDRVRAAPADVRLLRRFAADLAGALGGASSESLAEIRRELAAIAPGQKTLESGYRLALCDVIAAFESHTCRVEDERHGRELAVRESWQPVLRSLARGASRTTEIAQEIQRDKAQVSRWLSAMHDEGLVETFTAAGEVRNRYGLTLRGERIASALALESKHDGHADSLITFTLRVLQALRLERRLPRAQIERYAEGALARSGFNATRLCSLLAERGTQEGALHEEGGAWEIHPLALRDDLQAQLERALDTRTVPAFLEQPLAQAQQDTCLIRTSAALQGIWTTWKVKVMDDLFEPGRVLLLDWTSVISDEVEAGTAGILIYDSSSQLQMDLDSHALEVRALEGIAKRRFCVRDREQALPSGYEELKVA